jgi:hypothetical protein
MFGFSRGGKGAAIMVSSVERSFDDGLDPHALCFVIHKQSLRVLRFATMPPLPRTTISTFSTPSSAAPSSTSAINRGATAARC